MGDYPRIVYTGPADQLARTCLVHSDDQLATALASGWRRRRVPEPVIDPGPIVTAIVTPDPPTTTNDDLSPRSDPAGDPPPGDHASAIPGIPASARPTKTKTKKKKKGAA